MARRVGRLPQKAKSRATLKTRNESTGSEIRARKLARKKRGSKTKETREPKARMDAYEAIFTALAHPARRRILLTLNFEGGSMTAGKIADVFEHAWPTTTRHIQVLESAGLLRHEQQGRVRVYHIDRRRLELVQDWLAWFSRDPH